MCEAYLAVIIFMAVVIFFLIIAHLVVADQAEKRLADAYEAGQRRGELP